MITDARYTLLINGNDDRLDALPPLFTLFRKYWPGLDAPVVLNTTAKPYRHEGYNIVCPQLYKGYPAPVEVPWSKRLKATLVQAVHTDLVLLYLDDYYLCNSVNEPRLAACVDWMEANPRTACVYLFGGASSEEETARHSPWLAQLPKNGAYLFGLQAGLWRRHRLLHFLRDHESPWYFERWGSLRGRRYPDDLFHLAAVAGVSTVFDYSPSHQGLSGGKWLPKTPELFQKEGISLDLSIRGVINPEEPRPPCRRNWFRTAWNIWRSLRP